MTGFARRETAGDWGELAWELRSVNHRYLDLSVRLPEALRAIEPQIRKRVQAALGRGKVECVLRYNAAAADSLEVDDDRLQALVQARHAVSRRFRELAPVDPIAVLQWPGVVKAGTLDNKALQAAALDSLEAALATLQANRGEEGERLDGFFRDHLASISALRERLQTQLPQVQSQWRERLEAKLADLDQPVDPGRLEQEIVIAANKADVAEELSRLQMHIDAFAEALDKDEPVGRRLDFLMQEFNRETNTLSSKSQDAGARQIAVDIKVLIEQMREQVQNVE